MSSVVAMAVPARPGSMKVTQKDGTVLTVRLVGDEHMSYFINEKDGQKMFRADDGDLKPLSEQRFTQMKAVATERRALIEQSRAERLERLAASRPSTLQGGPRRVGDISGGIVGSKKGLVILVNYQDKSFTKTRQNFDDQFNKVGYNSNYHIGSVHDYFYDQSYGLFDLTFDVVGPVTVSRNMSYYGAKSGDDNDSHPAEMVIEACKLANDQVNFADYDWDGDGYVDQVFVVYAGYGEAQGASSNTIWPHEWELNSAAYFGDGSGQLRLDGVYVNTYACSCELSGRSGSTMDGIGTACHEFSHCLGYPDLYDTDYSGGWGMDSWDVMCAGSYNGYAGRGDGPCGYTSYERWLAGWLEPVELTEGKTITNMQPLNDSPEAYIIYNDRNKNEFIMLENRKNDKWFKYMPNNNSTNAYGLLAIHVDYSAQVWAQNGPNNDPDHQRVTIIPANKRYDTSYSKHTFAGEGGVKALTSTSHSSAGGKWWKACSTGSTALNHELTEITYNKTSKTINFLFDGGTRSDDGKRYTIKYVAGSGTCEMDSWTQTEWREEAVLPKAEGSRPGYSFVGWSTTNVAKTTEMPNILAAGTKLEPEKNMTLYAVYKYLYSQTSELKFKYTTAVSKDKDYLLVSSNEEGDAYAIDYTSLQSADGKGVPVTVRSVDDDMIIINPAPTSVWSCDYSSGSNTRRLVNSESYLSVTATGLALSSSAVNIMWSTTNGLYGQVSLSKYYVHPQEDGSFSVDKSTGNPVYAFEMVNERPTTYYANTFDYYTLTYLVDSVEYKQFVLEAGAEVVLPEAPEEREGYEFSGWIDLPEVMPAHDLEVYGNFTEIETAVENIRWRNATHSVYSLLGVRVMKDAKPNDIHHLPAGIYIVNGRKVVIK